MAKKKTIDLAGVRLTLHRDTAIMELTSTDERIKGKPFKLTLTSDSSSYRTLNRLFAEEAPSAPQQPLHVDVEELKVPGIPPAQGLYLGLRQEATKLQVDLAGNVVVTGGVARGKTTILRSVIAHDLDASDVSEVDASVTVLDPTGAELASYSYGPEDTYAGTRASQLTALLKLSDLVSFRRKLAKAHAEHGDARPADMPQHLVVDDVEELFRALRSPNKTAEERKAFAVASLMRALLSEIMTHGPEVGIYTVLAVSDRTMEQVPQAEFPAATRIVMGSLSAQQNFAFLEQAAPYGAELLRSRLRGVAKLPTDPTPRIFDAYVTPHPEAESFTS